MMGKRSLKASETGVEKAKLAFERTGWTQQDLASEVGLETRQSVWKFFKGRPIERAIFIDLCFKLDLDWQEIADLPTESRKSETKTVKKSAESPRNIEGLVQKVRSRLLEPIRAQCGTLRLLDSSQPVALNNIYVQVNILEQLSRQQWLEVSDLQLRPSPSPMESGRSAIAIVQKGIPALQAAIAHPKLMIFGKPGAGKTTFLQSLALECVEGKNVADRIPIFIRLRDWAMETQQHSNFSLLDCISNFLMNFDIDESEVESLLKQGKTLILLDGLDEICERDGLTIPKEIERFCKIYYHNHLVMTCRFAAGQYCFPGFTEVEIADFEREQIDAFAKKWFVAAMGDRDAERGLILADRFLEKLNLPENQPIRELAVTPILLTLTASVFQTKADFPNKRSKLYEAGLDILLVRWDEARGIQRDEVYRNLSLPRKIEMLSQIAAIAFKEGHCFFEKRELERYIADYLETLPGTCAEPEILRANSAAVLEAIEAQHGLLVERARGIYSFSHLTFQEYFTARHLASRPDAAALTEELQGLASHVSELRWREVFLLTAELLRNADPLLQAMKQQVDVMMAADRRLQQFLACISHKSQLVQGNYKPAAVRAFYLTLFGDRKLGLALALDPTLARDLAPELALDLELARAFSLVQSLIRSPEVKQILALSFALELDRALAGEPQLRQGLQELKAHLPDPADGRESLVQWWRDRGNDWAQQFRELLVEHRQIGRDWQFASRELNLLEQYYQANQLLVDCLHGESRCSSVLRSHLEASLILPVSEIETYGTDTDSTSAFFRQVSEGNVPLLELLP